MDYLLAHPSVLFAGLWPILWPILASGGVIVFLLFLAYISPLGKRYFVEAAIVVAIGLGVYQYGIHAADQRCRSQNIATTKVINKVVNKAVSSSKTRKSRSQSDPWNNKDN